MEPLDILHKFLLSGKFKWMDSVFLHLGDQGLWSVVANHHCAIAFKGELGERVEDYPLLPFLQQPRPSDAVRVELRSLLKWVSKVKPLLDVVDVNLKFQGVLAGVNIDLRKLSFILKLMPPGDIFVWDSTPAQWVKSLGFEIGPWRGCLAGVGSEVAECTNLFEVEESPLDLMLELESE
jgi:hypothetical protein